MLMGYNLMLHQVECRRLCSIVLCSCAALQSEVADHIVSQFDLLTCCAAAAAAHAYTHMHIQRYPVFAFSWLLAGSCERC
jgi:hypothetical protein